MAIGENAELFVTARTEARYEDNVLLTPTNEMCDCIDEFNAKLAPDQCLNTTMFGTPKAAIGLLRKDKWVPENRRRKPSLAIASFCPFCGEKYPEPERQAASGEGDTDA